MLSDLTNIGSYFTTNELFILGINLIKVYQKCEQLRERVFSEKLLIKTTDGALL